jgi:hypothetical protein
VKETGLPISFALSINKTVSKSTGEGKPKGHLDIPENQVRAFKPLSILHMSDVTFKRCRALEFERYKRCPKCLLKFATHDW